MTWFRVDDGFAQHPKVLAIPRRERRGVVGLWFLVGTWCAQQLTDGHVPHLVPGDEFGGTRKEVEHLLRVGLWERTDSGYLFHDWADYQPTREQVEGERSAARDRMRRARSRRSSGEQTPNDTSTSPEVALTRPGPSRPDPSPSNGETQEGGSPTATPGSGEPPLRCHRHQHNPADGPCGPCGDARREHDAWTRRPPPPAPEVRCPEHGTLHPVSAPCSGCVADARAAA